MGKVTKMSDYRQEKKPESNSQKRVRYYLVRPDYLGLLMVHYRCIEPNRHQLERVIELFKNYLDRDEVLIPTIPEDIAAKVEEIDVDRCQEILELEISKD